jgi:hypothetical protein
MRKFHIDITEKGLFLGSLSWRSIIPVTQLVLFWCRIVFGGIKWVGIYKANVHWLDVQWIYRLLEDRVRAFIPTALWQDH